MNNEYIDDTPSIQSKRKCVLCKKVLSVYNNTDRCFYHSEVKSKQIKVEEVTQAANPLPYPSTEDTVTITIEDKIIQLICRVLDVIPADLISETRKAGIVRARQIAMYLLYRDTKLSYLAIGSLLGNRDHSTVMHGANNIATLNMVDENMHLLIKSLRSKY